MDRYKITAEAFNNIASAYQDKFMELDLYNDTYDTFCQLVKKPNAKVLEVGCGPGNITKYILSKRPDLKITATDVAPNMLKLAKANNPTARFKLLDCREMEKLTDKFDAVISGFCMPYLSREDCAKFIQASHGLLNSNGILYFSTIEGDYQRSGYETGSSGQHKMYVYYHEESYLRQALTACGFELINVVRKEYPMQEGPSSVHLIIIAKKN